MSRTIAVLILTVKKYLDIYRNSPVLKHYYIITVNQIFAVCRFTDYINRLAFSNSFPNS